MNDYAWSQSRDDQYFREMVADGIKVVVTAERVESNPDKWRTSITSTLGGYSERFSRTAKAAKRPECVRLLLRDLLVQCGTENTAAAAKGAA
jgi:hypothetical protein